MAFRKFYPSEEEWKLVHGEQLDVWIERCVAQKIKYRPSGSPPDADELMILRLQCLREYDTRR